MNNNLVALASGLCIALSASIYILGSQQYSYGPEYFGVINQVEPSGFMWVYLYDTTGDKPASCGMGAPGLGVPLRVANPWGRIWQANWTIGFSFSTSWFGLSHGWVVHSDGSPAFNPDGGLAGFDVGAVCPSYQMLSVMWDTAK